MPSPFPGMDPYLEDPDLWTGFHAKFIVALHDRLQPVVRPKYLVRVEQRVYISDEDDTGRQVWIPDMRVVASGSPRRQRPTSQADGGLAVAAPISVVERVAEEVHEYYLEVVDRAERSVVTVVELLSPSNKVPGSRGRGSFLAKRREVYATNTHWIEIDLLRGGLRTADHSPASGTPYEIFLSRAGEGDQRAAYAWPVALDDRLPAIGVPLRGADREARLDLQAAFDHVYDTGAYDIDLEDAYPADPPPPAMPADALAWCRERIAAHQSSPD